MRSVPSYVILRPHSDAVDTVCAGVGDYVLLADEGGASRMLVSKYHTPVDAVIVGVIDELPELENQG